MAAPADEADCPPGGDRSATIRGRAGAAVEGPVDGVAAVEVDAVLSEVSASPLDAAPAGVVTGRTCGVWLEVGWERCGGGRVGPSSRVVAAVEVEEVDAVPLAVFVSRAVVTPAGEGVIRGRAETVGGVAAGVVTAVEEVDAVLSGVSAWSRNVMPVGE